MLLSQLQGLQQSAGRLLDDGADDAAATWTRARLLFNAGFTTLVLTPDAPAGAELIRRCCDQLRQLLAANEPDAALRGLDWHLRSLAEWLAGDYNALSSLQSACATLRAGVDAPGLEPESAAHLVRSLCELGERQSLTELRRTAPVTWRSIFVTGAGAADAAWLRTIVQHTERGTVDDEYRQALRRALQPRPDGVPLFELPVMAQYCRIASGSDTAAALFRQWHR
jgi:hypothetical protein